MSEAGGDRFAAKPPPNGAPQHKKNAPVLGAAVVLVLLASALGLGAWGRLLEAASSASLGACRLAALLLLAQFLLLLLQVGWLVARPRRRQQLPKVGVGQGRLALPRVRHARVFAAVSGGAAAAAPGLCQQTDAMRSMFCTRACLTVCVQVALRHDVVH